MFCCYLMGFFIAGVLCYQYMFCVSWPWVQKSTVNLPTPQGYSQNRWAKAKSLCIELVENVQASRRDQGKPRGWGGGALKGSLVRRNPFVSKERSALPTTPPSPPFLPTGWRALKGSYYRGVPLRPSYPASKLSGGALAGGGGGGKGGALATTSLGFEYLHWKSRCEILIDWDDISND